MFCVSSVNYISELFNIVPNKGHLFKTSLFYSSEYITLLRDFKLPRYYLYSKINIEYQPLPWLTQIPSHASQYECI